MGDPAANLPENPAEGRTLGADVNDTGKIAEKLQRQLELLDEADIPEADREAIESFFRYRRSEGVARNTLRTDLSTLRNASDRAGVPLVDMSEADMQDFLALLVAPEPEGGYGLKRGGGGMYNYKRALRVLFKWLDGRGDYGDYPFWEDVDTPTQDVERQDPDERLTWEDVQALKDAAARGQNGPRDRALVAMLAEGHRVTAVAQLRVGDVDPWAENPGFGLNDTTEDGYKDMENVERPLLWCQADLKAWIGQHHPDNAHPDGPRSEAPLWAIQTYDLDNPTGSALSNDGIKGVLQRTADRAGIEKPVNPHNFRHAMHTMLANDPDVDPRDQQHLGGWGDLRMVEHYDETSVEETNAAIRSSLGLSAADEEDHADTPDPYDCPNCTTTLTTEDYCPNCGEPRDLSTRLKQRAARKRTQDGVAEDADDPDVTVARAQVLDAIDDPKVWQMIEANLGSD